MTTATPAKNQAWWPVIPQIPKPPKKFRYATSCSTIIFFRTAQLIIDMNQTSPFPARYGNTGPGECCCCPAGYAYLRADRSSD